MSHSNGLAHSRKVKTASPQSDDRPTKPKDSPIAVHAGGHWCRKIKGRIRYFGPWRRIENGQYVRLPGDGYEAALARYNAESPAYFSGATPRTPDDDRPTIRLLCDKFLVSKEKRLGKSIGPRMFSEYKLTTDRLIAKFGKFKLVEELTPFDFESLWQDLSTAYGVYRLGNEIVKIKTVFRYGVKMKVIKSLPDYGEFEKPTKDEVRRHRSKQPKKLFTATELRKLIDAAPVQLKAMLLLSINCAYGAHDLATLPLSALDLKSGWVTFPRPKNGIERRAKLWGETVAALQGWLQIRPKVKAPEVFLRADRSWLNNDSASPLVQVLRDLMIQLGIHRSGFGSYTLRHTFRTEADGCRDTPAIRMVMGHSDGSIDAIYREQIDDHRLEAVATHVHAWLYGGGK